MTHAKPGSGRLLLRWRFFTEPFHSAASSTTLLTELAGPPLAQSEFCNLQVSRWEGAYGQPGLLRPGNGQGAARVPWGAVVECRPICFVEQKKNSFR